MSELLPCPFCGGKNQWIEDIDTMLGIRWYVFCPKCGAQGGRARTQVEAVNMWNMRATLGNGKLTAEIENLRQVVRDAFNGESVSMLVEGHSIMRAIDAVEADTLGGQPATTELQSLSRLKMAGRLRYWRGTIEIPEADLHTICDEIQAEHEQAIAATLGSGTCEMETDHDELELIASSHEDTWGYRCSACGWVFRYDRGIKPDYCPNCGRKVVSE